MVGCQRLEERLLLAVDRDVMQIIRCLECPPHNSYSTVGAAIMRNVIVGPMAFASTCLKTRLLLFCSIGNLKCAKVALRGRLCLPGVDPLGQLWLQA